MFTGIDVSLLRVAKGIRFQSTVSVALRSLVGGVAPSAGGEGGKGGARRARLGAHPPKEEKKPTLSFPSATTLIHHQNSTASHAP